MARNLQTGIRESIRASINTGLTGGNLFSSAPLDLRFALQKTLDTRITFTRASTGTFVGSDGVLQTATTNEARFDHNPTTGESLGLLVEEARTNLLLRSEEFDNASWVKTRSSVTANAIAAPNGTLTADEIIEDTTATDTHNIGQSISFISGTTYTVFVFAKATALPRFLQIVFPSSAFTTNKRPVFDLVNGTALAAADTTVSIQNIGNGWFRCVASTQATTTVSASIQLQLANTYTVGSGSSIYTGDGASGIYLWGAQLEAGAFATSYIPTTTATATRAADVASITGTAFSSFYNQTEGTVFGQFLRTTSTNSQQGRVFSFSDGTNTNALEIYQTSASNPSAQITATTTQAIWTPSGFTVGTSIKEVLGYQLNNSNASFNGSAETLDTACNIPTVTQARIGDRQDGVRNLNGTIQRLAYWPVRLADVTLQAITAS